MDENVNASSMFEGASRFMLQEHSRMIDVYQDLHVQKNELLKLYLAFASIPVSIIAVFLSLYPYLNSNAQMQNVIDAFQTAAVYLSILLVLVGTAVLMIMLRIRREQYLYVKTVNGTRQFFKEKYQIDSTYFVLPTNTKDFTFLQDELNGRTFWEAMIVGFTTSMLLAFLAWQLARQLFGLCQEFFTVVACVVFVASIVSAALFVKSSLKAAIAAGGMKDLAR